MTNLTIIEEDVIKSILEINGQKVMMDSDLAILYGVPTKRLNEQVKRNIHRFPDDFMFQLTQNEWDNLKSQNATSNWGGRRTPPYVFTEQGVAMLSSVLNSQQAIDVNIAIMRIFVKMRQWTLNYKDLSEKIAALEQSESNQNQHINNIYKIIEELVNPQYKDRPQIGYKALKP